MNEMRKAVAETLNEIKNDMECGCYATWCACNSNPIINEVMEKLEIYFGVLLRKLNGDPSKVTGEYGWQYEENEE